MTDRQQLDALLAALTAAGRPSSMSLPRPQGKRNFTELTQWLSAPPAGPAGQDRALPGPSGDVPVRVYRPAGQFDAPDRPAALFFHGGGWVFGGLDSHDALCRDLASQAGVVVVAVDYRLAPEHPFPAGLEDCMAATRWVSDHAADLGTDSSRLAVVGDSSGATLAAAVALLARDQAGPALALQVLAYPALDPAMATASYAANAEDPFLSRAEMEAYWALYLGGAEPDRRAAPALAADLTGLPPAYVLVAGRDVLRDEGVAYAERLRAAGVTASVQRCDEMVHGFLLCTRWLDAAREGVAGLARVLRTELGAVGGQ